MHALRKAGGDGREAWRSCCGGDCRQQHAGAALLKCVRLHSRAALVARGAVQRLAGIARPTFDCLEHPSELAGDVFSPLALHWSAGAHGQRAEV